MIIKKFESFEESFDDLESDIALLMESLIENLDLKKVDNDVIARQERGEGVPNGYYITSIIKNGEAIGYYFITQNPFDTNPSNSKTMADTLKKSRFKQSIIEELSKVTIRLEKFGYRWEIVEYNGEDQMGLYVYNKTSSIKYLFESHL